MFILSDKGIKNFGKTDREEEKCKRKNNDNNKWERDNNGNTKKGQQWGKPLRGDGGAAYHNPRWAYRPTWGYARKTSPR
jgi:hypothetical protein